MPLWIRIGKFLAQVQLQKEEVELRKDDMNLRHIEFELRSEEIRSKRIAEGNRQLELQLELAKLNRS